MTERDTDEARALVRTALASDLELRWTLRQLSPEQASARLGPPVAPDAQAAVVQVAVSLERLPPGASAVDVHLPALEANSKRIDRPGSSDPVRDTLLPAPADLVEVDVPEPYQRAPFEVAEPPPELHYVPGSGGEPAASKLMRTTVEAMTLGLVKGSAPGPRLTAESRRKLKAWRKRHQAAFDAWNARESALAAERQAARKAAMQHNTEVFEALQQWEHDRELAWRELLDWPCPPLSVGESCEGLVLFSSRDASPLALRFMATTDFPLDGETCSLTLSGSSTQADDLGQLFAPWAESSPQQALAPADYVAATLSWR